MGVAWAHLAQATVTARGTDAVRFVDNFTTASVGAVANGRGTEAFFTDGRGWVIALATILRTAGYSPGTFGQDDGGVTVTATEVRGRQQRAFS